MSDVKRYRFLEALDKVVGTEKALRFNENGWHKYKEELGRLRNIDNIGNDWWPTPEQQKAQIWEIQPEPIYVWGKCDDQNQSWLYAEPKGFGLPDSLVCPQKGLFSKDKMQKFKLVPVED